MKINKLFINFFIAASLVVASVGVTSCHKDNADNTPTLPEEPQPENPQPEESELKAGDNFYTYANAEWLESLEGANPAGYYGWFADINETNNEKLNAIMNNMPEYAAIDSSIEKLEENFDEAVAFITEVVTELVGDIKTKEDAFVAFGRAIGMGINDFGTITTAICYDDNTIGYSIHFPIAGEEEASIAKSVKNIFGHTTPKVERLKRYVSGTRSQSTVIDHILEGIGLDPQYYLHNSAYDEAFEALEDFTVEELKANITEGVVTALVAYTSDENVAACTDGKYKTVEDFIDGTIEFDLGYFTSYNYCNTYVTEEVQNTFAALGSDLIATFRNRLENNKWLSAATIEAAVEKLDYMQMDYGAPRTWTITEPLEMEGELLVADVLEAKAGRLSVIESVLGEEVVNHIPLLIMYCSPTETFYPYVVNAFYMTEVNAFFILPSLMMEPAYSPNNAEVTLYATLGCITGHEMTHGYDKTGAVFNKYGKFENWWTSEDSAKFAALNELRAANVSTYEILPGLQANGEQTVTEDVADLGGVNIAYDLWVKTLEERGVTGEELNEQKRAFFINYAMVFRQEYPESYIRNLVTWDVHSVGHIRINSVVQHIDDWYELFDVEEGDALYLAPEDRITIW